LAYKIEFLREDASFELRMAKIGRVDLKLFDSTLKLEIPILAEE
jgi:hypothetical protein